MWCRDWDSSSYLAFWPASKRLKSALTERKRGIKYTLPGMKYEFNEKKELSEECAQIMEKSFDTVNEERNWNGLKQLLDIREHLAAVEGTGKILTLLGQGMDKSGRSSTLTPFSLEIWSIRCQLLFGLKKFTELLDELTSFEELDAPDLFFQYHDEQKEGSMIPFALRMVHAEALVHSPLPIQAIGRVDRLIADVTTVIGNIPQESPESHTQGWQERLKAVKYMRSRIFHELHYPNLVVSAIEEMISEENEKTQKDLSFLLARIHLIRSEEEQAQQALVEIKESDEDMKVQHETFLSMYKGEREQMQALLEEYATNHEGSSAILNNLAIARLFNARPQEAASLLIEVARKCISSNQPLHPVIAQNIRTISEFTLANKTKDLILNELSAVLPQQ
ncbi:hypothetical protein PENTCL1PPCAC_28403 [Pristionchus entomophagus]|uniref:Uncharacterized protein n=1 Tax=Pristionchus entomophagus TaxID=358040 RepID=A0AAV5UGZ1_9BILA|nr:hypothetical protein PENTCL1PPCAC_28403 [Pristionchus entomophagus]